MHLLLSHCATHCGPISLTSGQHEVIIKCALICAEPSSVSVWSTVLYSGISLGLFPGGKEMRWNQILSNGYEEKVSTDWTLTLPPPPHIQPLIGLISSCCNSCASEFPLVENIAKAAAIAAGATLSRLKWGIWCSVRGLVGSDLSPISSSHFPLQIKHAGAHWEKQRAPKSASKFQKVELNESHPHIWAPAGPGPTAGCRSVHRRWDSCSCTPWTCEACRSWSAPCESAA